MTEKDDEMTQGTGIDDMENMLEHDIEEAEKAEQAIEGDVRDLSKISAELAILKDALARAQADYQNLLKRVERDRDEMAGYLTGNIILKILPSLDNLERMLSATPPEGQSGPLFEGVRSAHAGMLKAFESLGVRSFDSIGQDIDAMMHDVMASLPGEEGKIIQEYEKGYLIGDRVLRHAKVVAGNGEG